MQEAWRHNPGSPLYWEDRKLAFALIRQNLTELIDKTRQFADDLWNKPDNWRQNGEVLWSNAAENNVVSYFSGEASCAVGVYRRERDGKPCWAVTVRQSFYDDHHDEYEDYVEEVYSEEEGVELAEALFEYLSSRVNSFTEAIDERSQAYEDILIAEGKQSSTWSLL